MGMFFMDSALMFTIFIAYAIFGWLLSVYVLIPLLTFIISATIILAPFAIVAYIIVKIIK